jgi:predicted ATPase
LAREQGHPYTLALAYYYAAILHQFLRNPQRTHELAIATIALSQDQGFAYCLAAGTFLHGWTLSVQGQVKEGLRLMHEGRAAYDATGAAIGQPYFHALLAEAYGKSGQSRKGLQSMQDAFATAHDPAHYLYGAELYRIRGELLSSTRQGLPAPKEDAVSCFRQAITIAHQQGIKLFELRALVSANHCLSQQHLPSDMLPQLAAVVREFQEDADIPDLRAAKALVGHGM